MVTWSEIKELKFVNSFVKERKFHVHFTFLKQIKNILVSEKTRTGNLLCHIAVIYVKGNEKGTYIYV